jgi:hypothetical protein
LTLINTGSKNCVHDRRFSLAREASMKQVAAMLCAVLALGGCAHPKAPPSDYDVVLKQPKPTTDEARRQECSWIQTQLARQKTLATYVASTASFPELALQHQAAAQRNMAVLESRAANINCAAALPVPASGQGGLSFDACFARCKQYTERSNEQCFDACNR